MPVSVIISLTKISLYFQSWFYIMQRYRRTSANAAGRQNINDYFKSKMNKMKEKSNYSYMIAFFFTF